MGVNKLELPHVTAASGRKRGLPRASEDSRSISASKLRSQLGCHSCLRTGQAAVVSTNVGPGLQGQKQTGKVPAWGTVEPDGSQGFFQPRF